MDYIKNLCVTCLDSPLVKCTFAFIVLVLLILIYMSVNKQGFLNEFRSAPIASQRSTELLGVGNPLRFSSEFGSTNQGGSNVVSDTMSSNMNAGTEHMVGGFEAPVYHELNNELDKYQRSTASNVSGKEFFQNRNMFSEAFGDPDNKLKQILHGN